MTPSVNLVGRCIVSGIQLKCRGLIQLRLNKKVLQCILKRLHISINKIMWQIYISVQNFAIKEYGDAKGDKKEFQMVCIHTYGSERDELKTDIGDSPKESLTKQYS